MIPELPLVDPPIRRKKKLVEDTHTDNVNKPVSSSVEFDSEEEAEEPNEMVRKSLKYVKENTSPIDVTRLLIVLTVIGCIYLSFFAIRWNRSDISVVTSTYSREIYHLLKPWQEKGIHISDLHHREYDDDVFTVLILDNKLYYKNFTRRLGTTKIGKFDGHLRGVLKLVKVPDVVLLVNLQPYSYEHRKKLAGRGLKTRPMLSLCRTDEYDDILYPNMYFESPQQWKEAAKRLIKVGESNWKDKTNAVFWMGSCGPNFTTNIPRIVAASQTDHETLKVYFINKCPADTWYNEGLITEAERNQIKHFHKKKSVRPHKFGSFKYNLHLPGERNMTYSRGLQFLLALNTTILFWDNPWYEFYYMPGYRFKENVHYVRLTNENLKKTFAKMRKDEERSAKLAQNAREFFLSNLLPEHLVGYWKKLLHEYSMLQKFNPRTDFFKDPKEWCSCDPSINVAACSYCPVMGKFQKMYKFA